MYGDDAAVHTHRRDDERAAAKLLLAFGKVAKWLKDSCRTLNRGKVKYLGLVLGSYLIYFGGRKKTH